MLKQRLRLLYPTIFKLVMLCVASLAVAGLVTPLAGFAVMAAGLMVAIIVHLNYVALLAQWLENTDAPTMPATRSPLWSEIFYRVEKSRRALVKKTKRLSEREDRYRKTLAALPEGVILVKRDWALSWCNQNASDIFGIKVEDDFGRHMFAFVRDPLLLSWFKAGHFEEPMVWRPPESDLVYEISVTVADRKNALIIVRDVTEQERLDNTRRDFVANVSHELRTPLTVLMGFLDMAVQGLDDNASGGTMLRAEHMKLMRDQTARMQRIVNDLLTLSRLEIGSTGKDREVFSISDMVTTIAEEIRVMAQGTHTVTCDVVPVAVRGYGDEIRSAIVNLMTNAVRYTPEGGLIEAKCYPASDGSVVVSIRDNGIGIDSKHIPRLTERFYRVDKSRSRNTGGTGLGLAIVKHVLLHHGARMNIESTLGKGSTFSLVFPPVMRVAPGEMNGTGQGTQTGAAGTAADAGGTAGTA